MVRTRSSANKAVAAKAPRKLTATAKGGHVTKRGRSSRTLPPITPQPTPAWQKTIDKFLPKPEKVNEEVGASSTDNSGVQSFMDPGGSSDVQDTGVCEIVTGGDCDTPDKKMVENHSGLGDGTSGLQSGSDSAIILTAIAEVKSNGVEENNLCKDAIDLESDKNVKEGTSGAVETIKKVSNE